MALISFTFKKEDAPADATWSVHHKVWTWETHIGLCIQDRERNGYHDSDFYMLVWNDEKGCPEEIGFASTRGWTYPAMDSYVDATPEVLEKYKNWQAEQLAMDKRLARKGKARVILANRKIARSASAKWGFPYHKLIALRKHEDYNNILGLFNLRIRSEFKKSLLRQLVSWLNETSPKYNFPFSKKQASCLKPVQKNSWSRYYY